MVSRRSSTVALAIRGMRSTSVKPLLAFLLLLVITRQSRASKSRMALSAPKGAPASYSRVTI